MRKIIITFLCLVTLCTSILFFSCAAKKSNEPNASPVPNTNNNPDISNNPSSNKVFTASELAKYNGKNGNPAYVAVDGIVYDVTNAEKWTNGKHEDGIVAGKDLSEVIGKAPHGRKVLKEIPIIGTLKE
ncbi:cytochrome b5 domain-containing protein [Clostridium sp. 'White wine YQ']|uniref:cytochrome b5 domain-containing protein n=1 Tax=Clostridium sp. 'White wine YQ' TaxID=3027474 RepID=UPI0023673FF1|nr:cytochrome b5 domain-containing protein [Clostridium sp. 'White wine YQ']MDD7794460.1 cytochrome b5 domain-containing protein [Clostridium sp. 'White wine YQ']